MPELAFDLLIYFVDGKTIFLDKKIPCANFVEARRIWANRFHMRYASLWSYSQNKSIKNFSPKKNKRGRRV